MFVSYCGRSSYTDQQSLCCVTLFFLGCFWDCSNFEIYETENAVLTDIDFEQQKDQGTRELIFFFTTSFYSHNAT